MKSNDEPATQPANASSDDKAQPKTVEQRVDELGAYWGRALIDAWRTVFPKGLFQRKGNHR